MTGSLICGQNIAGLKIGCREQFLLDPIYRCTDCDTPFHKQCLKKHCADDLAAAKAELAQAKIDLEVEISNRIAVVTQDTNSLKRTLDERDVFEAALKKIGTRCSFPIFKDGDNTKPEPCGWCKSCIAITALKRRRDS